MISAQFRSELDPVALYAAVVSTATAIFGVVQYLRSGPRLTGHATGNMKFQPDPSGGTYISATISNRGTRRTTITMVGFSGYPNRWAKIRRKPNHTSIIPRPLHATLPEVLEPGGYLIASAAQDPELVALSKKSLLYFCAHYTDHNRPLELRVQPING